MNMVEHLIDKLNKDKALSFEQWTEIFEKYDKDDAKYAADIAREISVKIFGKKIYIRGIVEFSNVCRNDCYYCGIRCSNKNVNRYILSPEQILECCNEGYETGFRTFVLQSGEGAYSVVKLCDLVKRIKTDFSDCAVTLSVGELEYDDYAALKAAGADRYLLRHETADKEHYEKLHPDFMSFEHRMKCLQELKDLGYQTGAGIMVGSPYQTNESLAKDMLFFCGFKPHMIGIGPFLPHKDTPFKDMQKGSYELTLFILSLCRIALPNVLLPATTALGTIHPLGREQGVLSGANVIMPNMSPGQVRKEYMLYDNKICVDDNTSQCGNCLQMRLNKIGYEIEVTRGDYHD